MRLSIFLLPSLFLQLGLLVGCSDGYLYPVRGLEIPDGIDSATQATDPFDSSATGDSDTGNNEETATPPHFTVGSEAEDFDTSDFENSDRAWYVITPESTPDLIDPDDNQHCGSASGGTYLEVLPDLNTHEEDPNDDGKSLVSDPKWGAELGYRVQLETTGRYYVWVRGYTTGGKDNTIHVGIDGNWPASGRNIQLPSISRSWVWSSSQRDSGGKTFGIPLTVYLDVDTTGEHLITFAMREDGFEFDQWLITTDPELVPSEWQGW